MEVIKSESSPELNQSTIATITEQCIKEEMPDGSSFTMLGQIDQNYQNSFSTIKLEQPNSLNESALSLSDKHCCNNEECISFQTSPFANVCSMPSNSQFAVQSVIGQTTGLNASINNFSDVEVKQEIMDTSTVSVEQLKGSSSTSGFISELSEFNLYTENAIDTPFIDVSLHNHKTCPCSACVYKVTSEAMLEAKESEITSLKEIISNMENNQVGFNSTMMRVLDSKNELISNSTEIISQLNAIKLTLEKTVKDKSAQLELLERTVHHQINQFEDEIKRMKEENLQMKQFLEFERDIWKQSLNDKSEELKQIEKTNQNNVNKLKQSNEECKYLKLTNQSNQQRLSQLNENIDDYRQMAKECGVCHEVNKLKQQLNNLIEENVNLKLQLVKARDKSKQDKCKCPELNFNGQSNHENGNQLLVKENDHLKQALRSIQHVVDKLKKNAANISDKYCQIVTTE